MAPKDPPPLEPLVDGGMYRHNVIDLAGVRIQMGRTPYKAEREKCRHKQLVYNISERRIWCEECERPVEAFDAFAMIVAHFNEMETDARCAWREAQGAKNSTLIRRAAKELDRTWAGGMLPCCPHCSRGLMAHDFANGAASCISADLERGYRRRDIDKRNKRKNRNTEKPIDQQ